ncbi:MAG: hypothetical protein E6K06_04070 [Methanobacteriota archaeon]|nr:MAG: hypothetical protein E6K09_05785 [Euryarchaeota archaeon]TLZ72790.1 MAG: hypothetical protein E6K06_04070 [Euryarchaeota archaeon]
MDVSSTFRRAFHLISPVFMAYYLLPEELGGGITRTSVTLLFLGTAACIEVSRIALGLRMFGMRTYEEQRVSAYAQGALGLAFGLFVIRDPRIVIPVFIGMAWIDPLAGLCRRRGWNRVIPTATYFALFLGTVLLMHSFAIQNALFFSAAATVAAILVEGPKHVQIDDDFLMQVFPMLVVYYLLAGFGTGLGPSM